MNEFGIIFDDDMVGFKPKASTFVTKSELSSTLEDLSAKGSEELTELSESLQKLTEGAPEDYDTFKEIADFITKATKHIKNLKNDKADKTDLEDFVTKEEGNKHLKLNDNNSLVIGDNSTASGANSIVYGETSNAYGAYSFVGGYHNIANNATEVALGKYNGSKKKNGTFGDSGNTLFTIGNGIDNNSGRHNALEVRQDGAIFVSDIKSEGAYYQKPTYCLQDKINEMSEAINAVDIQKIEDSDIEDCFAELF